MILTCSRCAKRYLVDAGALGTGRRVRCASCGHTWFQTPPEEARAPIDLPPVPEPTAVFQGDPARSVQLPAVPRRRNTSWLPWAAIVVLVAGAGYGLVRERDLIISAWPPAARLYSMVGMGPTVPGFGLELRNITPSRGNENGVSNLAIDGEVANTTNVAREVPKLRVTLRDGNDRELKSWTVAVTDQRLLPGASVPFHTTVEQPPESATGVVVSFAPPGE
jgi:predicted Zn finger-like uncharacterized protein